MPEKMLACRRQAEVVSDSTYLLVVCMRGSLWIKRKEINKEGGSLGAGLWEWRGCYMESVGKRLCWDAAASEVRHSNCLYWDCLLSAGNQLPLGWSITAICLSRDSLLQAGLGFRYFWDRMLLLLLLNCYVEAEFSIWRPKDKKQNIIKNQNA